MQTHRTMIVEPVGLQAEALPKPLVWAELFNNPHPVELEIGMGKGTFLTAQAEARPGINFFGLEWANWFWRYASDRLRRHGCTNARTLRAEAHFFLREYVQDNSISVMHIYFPDPWPKARHNKRRLIQPEFLNTVHRVLAPGGRLQVVTDHADYWAANIQPFVSNCKLTVVDYDKPTTTPEGETVGTNFERKYIREGRPFYSIAAIKPPPVSGPFAGTSGLALR